MAFNRQEVKKRRHERVRKKVRGLVDRPRLVVHRSLKHIYTQIVDDVTTGSSRTLVSACSLSPELRGKGHMAKKAMAYEVGKLIAEKAKAAGIEKVSFDRGGLLYHGRVAEVARGAREGGLSL